MHARPFDILFAVDTRVRLAFVIVLSACGSAQSTAPPFADAEVDRADGSADAASGDDSSVFDAGPILTACTASGESPPSGSSTIFYGSSPVAPSQTALLFGGHVGASATVEGIQLADGNPGLPPRPADCVPSTAEALTVLEASDVSVKAEIPTKWTAGLYALAVTNAAGRSAPIVLNRPRIDWIHSGPGGAVVAGSTVDVYGRSFGAKPRAWIAKSGGGAPMPLSLSTGSMNDGYAATFAVPLSIAAGTYDLYVHSGQGGPVGFSDAFAVTVVAPAPWPTTVFSVAAKTGNDDAALAKALASAKSNGGGIIELASGSYTLHAGVVIPPKTVIKSASGNRSDVTIDFVEPASPVFPYGFASDGYFVLESLTITSTTAARLVQCPSGADYLRDPITGQPQYQPDAPCQSATVHDVSLTLNTLRYLVQNGKPTTTKTPTILLVMNGDDCELSDSTLLDTNGSAISLAQAHRLYLLRNTLYSGTTQVAMNAPVPPAPGEVGGGAALYGVKDSAIVGNTVGAGPNLGNAATMYLQYDAHDLYIADNTFAYNTVGYGEGFAFDAPYYPNFIGAPSSASGRSVTIPRVVNQAGNSVFAGPLDGRWPASGGVPPNPLAAQLAGSSMVVVNGTGLGQYAEIVSNVATAADGSTQVTVDRDWAIPLDKTSVVEIAMVKSKVVFARNTFHDVAVGAQLYAGGYDFIIDGTMGQSMEGTYCNSNDVMTARASSQDLQRRFSRCYFNQWINNTLTNQVDATYPWAKNPTGGVFRPYANGIIGVNVGLDGNPLLPAQRGICAVGNMIRANDVEDFTLGLTYSIGGQTPSPLPSAGQDNIVEQNQTSAVPIGVFVKGDYPGTLVRDNQCASGCQTVESNQNDGGA